MADRPDLDELRRLRDAATPGSWRWGGNVDYGDVRLDSLTTYQPTVLARLNTLPCFIEDEHFQPVATKDACDECKARRDAYEAGDVDAFDGYRCSRTDLPGIAFCDPDSRVMRPATAFAVKERDYRGDIASVDHPDAALIVAAVNALGWLLDRAADADRYERALREVAEATYDVISDESAVIQCRGIALAALARPDTDPTEENPDGH